MDTFTYDVRVRRCTRQQFVSYARAAGRRSCIGVQLVDAPPGAAAAAYRVVVRPGNDGTDAATTMAALSWLLEAGGRLVSVRPRA